MKRSAVIKGMFKRKAAVRGNGAVRFAKKGLKQCQKAGHTTSMKGDEDCHHSLYRPAG
jgi:hypothetical protein